MEWALDPHLCPSREEENPEMGKMRLVSALALRSLKAYVWGRSQDGGGIGWGDHFLFYKFIERTVNKVYKTTSDP